jgi:hypothetical protein
MKKVLSIAAFVGLAACAGAPENDSPDLSLAFATGRDLSCNASDMTRADGEVMTLHVSLDVPDRGGSGRFCIATGCEDARFEPTLTRAPGWTAIMRTNDRTNYNAELEIARDLQTFRLRQVDSSGVRTWTGTCSAAGS